jgi:hypothetical protein
MAAETTKYQINFKTHKDGTLINIYADSIRELETQITDISMISALIKSTEAELYTGARNVASAPSVESVAQAFGATPVATPAPAAAPSGGNSCRHGVMTYREGVNAQGKPWKGYLCAAPKGATDKCDAIWVR